MSYFEKRNKNLFFVFLILLSFLFSASVFKIQRAAACSVDCTILTGGSSSGEPTKCEYYPFTDLLGSHNVCFVGNAEETSGALFSTGPSCTNSDVSAVSPGRNTQSCQTSKCPSFNYMNGAICKIISGAGFPCTTGATATGVWDQSQSKCIQCSGKKENKVCGNNSSLDLSCALPADGAFDTACNASVAAACDDVAEGGNCGGTNTCDANGQCVSAAACDTKPTVTIVPATQSAVAGTPLTYTIDIRNNDDASCPTASRTFNLSSTVPGGWAGGSFASASLAVAKGSGTNSTAYTLTSPAAAAKGNYNFTVTGADAKGSSTANGVYTVTTCSLNTYTEFDSDIYKIDTRLKITYAIASVEPTNDFINCVYTPAPNLDWEGIPIAHTGCPVGCGNIGSGIDSAFTTSLGTWTVSLEKGVSCPAAPSGCIGSTEVVECLVGADCPSLVCDFGTHRCTAGPGPGATCAAGDGCLAGCVPPDPDCAAGGTTVGFSSNCYQLIGPAIAATANYTGAATGPNDTIILYKPDNSVSSCMQVTGASGTSNYNLNANGVWTVKIHSGSDCAAPGAVKATATTTVQNTPCGGPACAALGAACASGSDCCSGVCDKGNTNTCIEPRCNPKDPFYCNPIPPINTLTQAGETLIAYILGLIGSIALLFIIIAGLMYMTSAGSEERIANSKRILTGAVIGLGIALLAYSLLQVIITILNL